MIIRKVLTAFREAGSRELHLTSAALGSDGRGKRLGHVRKTDKVEGEFGAPAVSHVSYELIDENLMDRMFGHLKFKDVPVVHIKCSRNNTKVCLAQGDKILSIKSGGTEGYKHCRKGTTVAAQAVANRVLTACRDLNIDMIRLVFNGLGPGRNAAYRVFELSGIKVISLSDRTEAVEPWIQRPRAAKSL